MGSCCVDGCYALLSNMNTELTPTREELNKISGIVISSAIEVHRHMGPGLLESIYQQCLIFELRSRDLRVAERVPVKLQYKTYILNKDFFLDLVVEDTVLVELKSIDGMSPVHDAQLLSYLKLTGKRLGLIINFNVPLLKEGIRRMVHNF
jgi:GxxExxY protein